MNTKARNFRYAAWGVLAYNLAVVVWGAFVRASFSGDGCGTHWPTCHGEIIPPQGVLKTLVEYSHRLSSGIALLLVVGLGIWAFIAFPRKHWVRRGAVYAVIFIFSEALVGAGLVLFELVTHNESAYRALALSLHLMNTFVLLAFIFATAWAAGRRFANNSPLINWHRQGPISWILWGAIGLMLLTGVWGSIAALGDMLFPSASLAEGLKADFSPLSSLWIRLRWVHPFVAILTAGYLMWGASFLSHKFPQNAVQSAARAVLGFVVLQTSLGILNWILMAPIPMQLLHLLVADGLWLSTIWLALEVIHHSNFSYNDSPNKVELNESLEEQGTTSMGTFPS